MNLAGIRILITAALALLGAGQAMAQGTFTDASGAVHPGFVMMCVDTSTGKAIPATSGGTCPSSGAAVKGANTAPTASDQSMVVSISPNSAGLVSPGQAPSANSTPVVIATDQSPVPVKGVAGAVAQPVVQIGSAALGQGAVSATTTAGGTLIVPARTGASGTGRRSVTLWNRTGTDAVSLGNSGIVAGQGAYLGPAAGASVTIDTQAAIYGIVPTTAQSVSFLENF